MDKFPQMLFRCPGPEQFHGGTFTITAVDDMTQLEAAVEAGWHETPLSAIAAFEATKATEQKQRDDVGSTGDNAPPTRAELEQKAKELGLEFSPNIGDKKLAERIAEKLKG